MFRQFVNSVREFLDGVRSELKKVSFPSKSETIGATTVVIVFCILMSLYLSVIDSLLGWLMRKVIRMSGLPDLSAAGRTDLPCVPSFTPTIPRRSRSPRYIQVQL